LQIQIVRLGVRGPEVFVESGYLDRALASQCVSIGMKDGQAAWMTGFNTPAWATFSEPAGLNSGPKTEIFCAPLFCRIDFIKNESS
jgi:hypothetical protein